MQGVGYLFNFYERERMFIKKILIETFNYGVENRTNIFNSLKYPALGMLISSLLSNSNTEGFTVLSIMLFVSNFYFTIIFTTNCHRLFLKKEVPTRMIDTIKWNSINTGFLISTMSLSLSFAVCTIPIICIYISVFEKFIKNSYFFVVLMVALIMPIAFYFSKLSLMLPATAAEEDNSFLTALSNSENNGWNLFILVGILPVVTGFIISYVGSAYIVTKFITSILSIMVLFYEVSILSNSYQKLTGRIEATS